jgi:hypothetical protein
MVSAGLCRLQTCIACMAAHHLLASAAAPAAIETSPARTSVSLILTMPRRYWLFIIMGHERLPPLSTDRPSRRFALYQLYKASVTAQGGSRLAQYLNHAKNVRVCFAGVEKCAPRQKLFQMCPAQDRTGHCASPSPPVLARALGWVDHGELKGFTWPARLACCGCAFPSAHIIRSKIRSNVGGPSSLDLAVE